MRVTVHVTASDIAKGIPLKLLLCPVARAMARATASVWSVFYSYAMCDGSIVILPAVCHEFIVAFDSLKPVAPFDFEIDLPPMHWLY